MTNLRVSVYSAISLVAGLISLGVGILSYKLSFPPRMLDSPLLILLSNSGIYPFVWIGTFVFGGIALTVGFLGLKREKTPPIFDRAIRTLGLLLGAYPYYGLLALIPTFALCFTARGTCSAVLFFYVTLPILIAVFFLVKILLHWYQRSTKLKKHM